MAGDLTIRQPHLSDLGLFGLDQEYYVAVGVFKGLMVPDS